MCIIILDDLYYTDKPRDRVRPCALVLQSNVWWRGMDNLYTYVVTLTMKHDTAACYTWHGCTFIIIFGQTIIRYARIITNWVKLNAYLNYQLPNISR